MTNPKNKLTEFEFREKVNNANGHLIKLHMDDYTGVDARYNIECVHGINTSYGWALLKEKKHCCNKGYHSQRTPTLTKSLDIRISEIKEIWNDDFEYTTARFDTDNRKIILKCKVHGEVSQWIQNLLKLNKSKFGCPCCTKETQYERNITNLEKARVALQKSGLSGRWVSKSETKWLDELNIQDRQVWLTDIHYRVDGFDLTTNTVYLYHGNFWHGCLTTYDPEMQHPILKIKMKDLYEKTMYYENKIKEAGYNLITKWGT